MKIKLHTYPQGGASRMAQDEIVSKLTELGSFSDCYVADLEQGDKYLLNPNRPLPSIGADYILQYLEDHSISCEVTDEMLTPDDEHESVYTRVWTIYNSKGSEMFKGTGGMNLKDCISHVIEMEEL